MNFLTTYFFNLEFDSKIDRIQQNLLLFFAFSFPLSVSLANLTLTLLVILWFFDGKVQKKIKLILENKFVLACLFFYFGNLIGLLWTDDLLSGLKILKKYIDFLVFIPVLITITKKSNVNKYLNSFSISMIINIVATYLLFFGFINEGPGLERANPVVFMDHISYGIFLIFFSLLMLNKISYNQNNLKKFAFLIISFISFITIFIVGGRSMQLTALLLLPIVFFQHYKISIKNLLYFVGFVIASYILILNTSATFIDRTNLAVNEFQKFFKGEANITMSVPTRLRFTINSLEIIEENFFWGVGTGDYKDAYSKINKLNSPNTPYTDDPHNMFIKVAAEIGIFGLILYINIFFSQLKFSLNNTYMRSFGLYVPISFFIISIFGSYLLGHFSTMLFIFFSSIVFKNYE